MSSLTNWWVQDGPHGDPTSSVLADLHGLVGGDLSRTPYLSSVGALIKLSRLNHFTRRDLLAAFGFRLVARESPTRVLGSSERRIRGFAASIAIDAGNLPGWQLADWIPFQHAGRPHIERRRLRACVPCLKEGFHTWLFQLPWVTQCPWHRTRLVDGCPACGTEFEQGFVRGMPFLRCPCGIDFFDRHAALRAGAHRNPLRDRILGSYLDWARSRRTLDSVLSTVADHPAEQWRALLPARITPPLRWRRLPAPTARPSVTARAEIQRELQLLGAQLDGDPPAVMVLPARWARPLRAITANIAKEFWSRPELVTAETAPEGCDCLYTEPGGARGYRFLLPMQASATRALLDRRCIPKPTLGLAIELADTTRKSWRDLYTAYTITRALRMLLFRGYADGLRTILARYAPKSRASDPVRRCRVSPLVLTTRDYAGVTCIRIAWPRSGRTSIRAPPRPG